MSRVVISCYEHEDNPYCAYPMAAIVRGIARSLSSRHEVVVISGSFPGCRAEGAEPFRQIFLSTSAATPQIQKLLFPVMLVGAVRRMKYDLWIESTSGITGINVIPHVTSKPVIALLHPRICQAEPLRGLLSLGVTKKNVMAGYRQIITLSNCQDDLVTERWRGAGRVIVPPATSPPRSPPDPGEGGHILFLGDIHVSHNGLDLLLAAVAAANPRLPVLIAGAGRPAEERKLTRLLEQARGPAARIGSVPGPGRQALLRECAFVVLPSRCPSSDLPLLEAMAWGKPVVHFDLPELDWTTGESAIRVPAFDVHSLAIAIDDLATDVPRRMIMGNAARKVAEQYSWEHIGKRYQSIVDDCMHRPARPVAEGH